MAASIVTTAEKQATAIEAVRLQREALNLSRYASLSEYGAGDFAECAARLESAVFHLRLLAIALRREADERRGMLPRRAA